MNVPKPADVIGAVAVPSVTVNESTLKVGFVPGAAAFDSSIESAATLMFKSVKEAAPVTGIEFKIDVLTSYTIPIMVRTKKPNVKVTVDSFAVEVDENQQASFRVDLRKQGESSVTGEISLYHTDDNGKENRVGILRGVNIFHENTRRIAYVQWQNYTGPVKGKIRLEYVGAEEFSGIGFAQYETSIGLNDFN